MATKVLGVMATLALIALGATVPARAQFMSNYPVIIVPPPAQNLVAPRPAPKQTTPDKPKPSANPPAPPPAPAYQGRTQILNR